MLFPEDGGPAILEFELSEALAKRLIASSGTPIRRGKALNYRDEIAFDIGHGIEQLLEAWPDLKKSIILLADE